MKKSKSFFNIIVGYYVLTYLFYIFKLDSFIKDIFIVPLFYLAPAGFGLLVLSVFSTHKKLLKTISVLQLILSGTFLGFLAISLIYTELNNHDVLNAAFPMAYPLINILSLLGFYRMREVLQVNDDFRMIGNTFLRISPLLLIVYYYLFIHFSSFPLRDIFMETHFMKGALEFSKYHIINIATGDTYFHLLQVHTGLLHHFFGYSLIHSQWIMPVCIYLMCFVCFYCFYVSLTTDRFTLIVVMALNTVFTSFMFSNSNNTYIIMVAVVFFSLLVSKNRGQTRAVPVLLELAVLCGLSIVFFINRNVPSYESTMLPILLSYILIMLAVSYVNYKRFLPLLFIMLIIVIAPPYHRASSLYIPLTLLLYTIYFICFQWRSGSPDLQRETVIKRMITAGIITAPLCIVLEVLVTSGWAPGLTGYAERILNPIFLVIVNQRISDNQGIVGTTAEFVRFVPPLVFVVSGLCAFDVFRKRNNQFTRGFINSNFSYISFCLLSSLILLIFFFSPLPNVHRLLVFPVLMIFALTAILFKYYYECYFIMEVRSKMPLLTAVLISLYTLVFKIIYDLPWKYPDIASPYIAELAPITYIGWALITISLIALVMVRKRALIAALVVVMLVSGLMLDRFNIVTKLYGNAYGYDSPNPGIISHYTLPELRTAERLGDIINSPGTLMFSDPSTLGIFEARTGINGFYTFSNLGVMLDVYKNDIREIIRHAFPDVAGNEGRLHAADASVASFLRDRSANNLDLMLMLADFCGKYIGAMPEAKYLFQSRLGIPIEVQTYKDSIQWSGEFKDRIYWVLNEKTIKWAYEGDAVGYYPMNTPFTDDYIKNYIVPYFDVIINSDNAVLVLKLK